MNTQRVLKSTQQQAYAAWVDMLNQIRVDRLIDELSKQDTNLEEALKHLQKIRDFTSNPANILGSDATKHGEIAEQVQVHISNARRVIDGLQPDHTFDGVPRTDAVDYLRNGMGVQSKFYAGDTGSRSFNAILQHLKKYPDFMKNGGTYDIPKDQYEHIVEILDKKPSELTRSEYYLVKKIREWEKLHNISFKDKVNPSVADYADVQTGKVDETVDNEEKKIRDKDKENRNESYRKSKPSLKEGAKAAAVSAAAEGGMTFCLKLAEKLKAGKKISEFTADDWKDIGIKTAESTLVGGIRGGAVYVMSNFTATPAAVASAFVTAAVGTVTQAVRLRNGDISEEEFLINSQVLSVEVSVSAVSSILGQALIPVPVIGAVIGSVMGNFLYGIVKDNCSKLEQDIIKRYNRRFDELNRFLDERYKKLIAALNAEFKKFFSIAEYAFSPDANTAFANSIKLAEFAGVSSDKILKNKSDIDNFFLL